MNVATRSRFVPGLPWLDTSGNAINAHGGGVLFHEGVYYWYGEHKIPGRSEAELADGGVHAYSSRDLYVWKDEGLALAMDEKNPESEIALGSLLERPKVLFDAARKRFVMHFKLYPKGKGYDTAFLGVALSERPSGPFRYSHRFLSAGSPKGSGDFSVQRDLDGKLYHLAVRKPDKAFCLTELLPDGTGATDRVSVLEGIPAHTEAPAFVRHENHLYLIGSGSTGWDPNAARSFRAPGFAGPYTDLGNPCRGVNPHRSLGPELSFGGQISFILPVVGKTNAYIAMFDLWHPARAIDGIYAWLPLFFENGKPVIEWRSEWDLSVFS